MIVYRLCKENEKEILLNDNSFENIGAFFKIISKRNTHLYKENKKYIHFFKRFDSLVNLNTKKGRYICTYDIPDDLLAISKGFGFYLSPMFYRHLEKIEEYALECEKMDFGYLISVDKIVEDIDFDDFIDCSYCDKIERIYSKNEKKLVVRK